MEYYASIFVNVAKSFKFPRPYVNMDAIKVEKITSPSTLIWFCVAVIASISNTQT